MSDDLGLSPKRRKIDQELDKISYLPEPLIDKILSLLPILDAVRTSVLSSSWRFKWTTLSKLVFDDRVVVTDESSKLGKIIDNILLLHSGPVKRFQLSHRQYQPTSDIDIWIRHLSKASISEFILFIRKGQGPYRLPSSLFCCQDLTQLVLYKCSVTIPPTFRGFKNLKILKLELVPMSEEVLENFIAGSRLLWNLTLKNYRFKKLMLDVPKLGYLNFSGSIEGISFRNTCCSPSVRMKFVSYPSVHVNLQEFFAPLRNIKTLILEDNAIKFTLKEVPAALAEPFLRLKNLTISGVNFKIVKQILVILCLLRSAPNLNQVKLSAREGDPLLNFLEGQIEKADDSSGIEIYDSPPTFAHLKSVWLTGIGDSTIEMGFIGAILSSSPALEKMTIKAAKSSKLCPSGRGDHKLLKNMMRFQCRSARANLVFL